jgi:large subunit ribosomal protein L28
MTFACDLTGKGAQSGNKVSHSQRKSRRVFMPNIQHVALLSDALGRRVPLRIAASTLRTVEHNGGLDSYLIGTSNLKLTPKAVKLKKQVQAAKSAA